MNKIKIILTVSVIATICVFIYIWFSAIILPTTPPEAKNVYTKEIQRKINLLSKAPIASFSVQEYKDIEFSINEFFKSGYLGITPYQDGKITKEKKDENNNLQWRDILLKNLYSVYSQKFIDQSMYVFKGTAWVINDLAFIRSEVRKLKNSLYLIPNSAIDDSLSIIQSIISEYDTINNFLGECNNFHSTNNEFESTFPDVSQKIQASRSFSAQVSNHTYLRNCSRLQNGLNQVPEILFDKHVNFLTDKINTYGNMYESYTSQREYSNAIYTPIRNQLDVLSNDAYGVNTFESSKNYLENLLSECNRKALSYFIPKPKYNPE
jgi:hypothetical protein